jgi:hypothetical protein
MYRKPGRMTPSAALVTKKNKSRVNPDGNGLVLVGDTSYRASSFPTFLILRGNTP